MYAQAVSPGNDDLLRSDQSVSRKICRKRFGSKVTDFAFAAKNRRMQGNMRIGPQHQNRFVVAGAYGGGLNSDAGGQGGGVVGGGRDSPDMAPVDVVLIRREDDL